MAPLARRARAKGTETIRITVVGRCDVSIGRRKVSSASAVLFGLMLYLGLRPGRPATREELLDLFWGSASDRARRHALRQLLYRMRNDGIPVEISEGHISLDSARVQSDLAVMLEPGWADAVRAGDLKHPHSLFAGYKHPFGNEFTEWIESLRDDASAATRTACVRHIASGRREGRWSDVEAAARICVDCDPMNESAHTALAEAVAMSGSKVDAIRGLDAFLWDVGNVSEGLGREARILRQRIAALPDFRLLRMGEPPLVGRAAEVAWLNDRAEEALRGAPVHAFLTGVPGIGKTAIARAFISAAEIRGWQCLRVNLEPSDAGHPTSLVMELIQRLLATRGSIGAAPESLAQLRRLIEHRSEDDDILAGLSQEAEAVKARIRSALADVTGAVADETPLVLVLEDLHWVDESSLAMIGWLAQHGGDERIVWVLTARPELRYAAVRELFPADRIPSLVVNPLDEEESRELFMAFAPTLSAKPEAADAAYAVTGGNPLFIREMAGLVAMTGRTVNLPQTLQALMTARVARLTASAQRLLDCCAVLGRHATMPRVIEVIEMPTAELLTAADELDRMRLVGLSGEPGSLALHDLWQEQVTKAMRPAVRSFMNLRAGLVLEAEARNNKASALVLAAASHLVAGGARDRATGLLEMAVTEQLRVGLYDDAVECAEKGLGLEPTVERQLGFAMMRLQALQSLGRWRTIHESVPVVEKIAESCGKPLGGHTDFELLAIEAEMLDGLDFERTTTRLVECVDNTASDTRHRADAARLGARAAANCFMAERLASFAAGVAALDQSDDYVHAQSLAVGVIYNTDVGNLSVASDTATELVAVERSRQSVAGLIRSLRYRSIPLRALAEYTAAFGSVHEAYRLARTHRLAEEIAIGADILGNIMFESGRLADATHWLMEAERVVSHIGSGYTRASVNCGLAMIAIEEGDSVRAATLMGAIPTEQAGPRPTRATLAELAVRLRLAVTEEDREEAGRLSEHLASVVNQVRGFGRLGYAVASLAIATEWIDSHEAARMLVSDYRRTMNTREVLWRELTSRFC